MAVICLISLGRAGISTNTASCLRREQGRRPLTNIGIADRVPDSDGPIS
jgi:hypothetical protein